MTTNRTHLAAFTALILTVGAAIAAFAQENQGMRDPTEQDSADQQPVAAHQTAQVGAGTDNATTTGFSGPKKSGGSKREPPEPQSSLCDRYGGAVKQSCLETVLRTSPRSKGG